MFLSLPSLFFREYRHETCSQSEKEDGRSDEANRNAPLENRWEIGRGCDLRHRPFQVHGQQNDVDAVENHSKRGAERTEKEHCRLRSERRAGKKGQWKDTAEGYFRGEQHSQSSRKCAGQLATNNHIAQPKEH